MKRVLIIAYYWPPAGGPGVQRWLKFVKYFRDYDIEPVVYVPENPHYPIVDNSLAEEIPEGITILKHPIKEPYQLAKLFSSKKTTQLSSGIIPEKTPGILSRFLLFVRGNYFIPDARVGWVGPSVKFINKYLIENPVDVLVTTGPPHSLHLIGLKLQKKTGLPWLADFRDPWTTIHYHKSLRLSESSAKKHKELESEVLNAANIISVTSPSTKKEFENNTRKPIEVITNGYDTLKEVIPQLDDKFSLVHIGSLLSERNPIVLWDVLSELKDEIPGFKEDLQIKLIGTVSDTVVRSLDEYGLGTYSETPGYVNHNEALQTQANAQMLLLLEIDKPETTCIIPGKLFEYMNARRPILAIGPENSDIEVILKEQGSGTYFTPAMLANLKEQILVSYNAYKRGELGASSINLAKYSRKSLTGEMANLLHRL